MTGHRLFIHSLFLIALPIIVADYGISTAGAVALVLLALLWRVAISLSGLVAPAKVPALELETITASHFAEKVRWSLDRLGVDYTESPKAGIFGVLFQGRTVPQLKIRTGNVRSVIGNSPEILRYLWGRYVTEYGDNAEFLEPTAERVEMEQRIDRYGVNLQVWVYYHVLDHPALTQRVWGRYDPAVPAWQRLCMPILYPLFKFFLRKTFRISDEHYARVVMHIEKLLAEIEERLGEDGRSILGGDEIDYVDISFAAMSGLWLQPDNYAGGRSKVSRLSRDNFPLPMNVDVERWCESYPKTLAFIERLYEEERLSG